MDATKCRLHSPDVNSVVINATGHIFAGAAGGVFPPTNDADERSNISSGLLPPGGMSGRS